MLLCCGLVILPYILFLSDDGRSHSEDTWEVACMYHQHALQQGGHIWQCCYNVLGLCVF